MVVYQPVFRAHQWQMSKITVVGDQDSVEAQGHRRQQHAYVGELASAPSRIAPQFGRHLPICQLH